MADLYLANPNNSMAGANLASSPSTWINSDGSAAIAAPAAGDRLFMFQYGDYYNSISFFLTANIDLDAMQIFCIHPTSGSGLIPVGFGQITCTGSTTSQRRKLPNIAYPNGIIVRGTPYLLTNIDIMDANTNIYTVLSKLSLRLEGDVSVEGNINVMQQGSTFDYEAKGGAYLGLGVGTGGLFTPSLGSKVLVQTIVTDVYPALIITNTDASITLEIGTTSREIEQITAFANGWTTGVAHGDNVSVPGVGFRLICSGSQINKVSYTCQVGFDYSALLVSGTGLEFVPQFSNGATVRSLTYNNTGVKSSNDASQFVVDLSIFPSLVDVTNNGGVLAASTGTAAAPFVIGSYTGSGTSQFNYTGGVGSKAVIQGNSTLSGNAILSATNPNTLYVEGSFTVSGMATWNNVNFDPTTATLKGIPVITWLNAAKSQQLAEDKSVVTSAAEWIIRTTDGAPTILGVSGTFDLSAETESAAQSARDEQLAQDKAAIAAAAQWIIRPADGGVLILSIEGAFDLSMAKEAAAEAQFVIDQNEVREKANSILAPDRGGQLILGIEGTLQAITSGGGSVIVNHNFGETDALRVLNAAMLPVAGVAIFAYVASDYAIGGRNAIAAATTASDGRWEQDMKLNTNTYTLTFDAPGKIQAARTITVTEN